MQIESIRHKALRSFVETGKAKGLDARLIKRLRNMIALISAAKDVSEMKVPPNFGFHMLTGDRAGMAAMTVTKNWRLTFGFDEENRIINMDLEDYH